MPVGVSLPLVADATPVIPVEEFQPLTQTLKVEAFSDADTDTMDDPLGLGHRNPVFGISYRIIRIALWVRLLMLTYYCLMVPWGLSFGNQKEPTIALWIGYAFDFFNLVHASYWVDQFIKKKKGAYSLTKTMCLFLGSFPFDLIGLFLGNIRLVYALRLLRFLHMPYMLDLLNHRVQFHFIRKGNPLVLRMVEIVCLFLFVIHIFACIWHPLHYKDAYQGAYDGDRMFQNYVSSVYFCLICNVNIGYGDVTPGNSVSIGYVIFMMATGFYIKSYFGGHLVTYLFRESNFTYVFYRKLELFKRVMINTRVEESDARMSSTIVDYLFHQWDRTHGMEDEELMALLPRRLRRDLLLERAAPIIMKVPYLKGAPDGLLRLLAEDIRVCIFPPEFSLAPHTLFMLVAGEIQACEVEMNPDGSEKSRRVLQLFGAGSFCGKLSLHRIKNTALQKAAGAFAGFASRMKKDSTIEIEHSEKEPRLFVSSRGYCDTLTLANVDFQKALAYYPKYIKHLRKEEDRKTSAQVRGIRAFKAKRGTKKFLADDFQAVVKATNVIKPTDPFRQNWDMFIFACILYYILVIPWRMSYVRSIDTWFDWTLLIMDYTIDIVIVVDSILRLTRFAEYIRVSGTTDQTSISVLCEDPQVFRAKYLRSFRFFFTVLSCFPLEALYPLLEDSEGDLLALLRINKLLHVIFFYEYVQKLESRVQKLVVQYGTYAYSAKRLVSMLIFTIVFTHVYCSLWYYVAFLEDEGKRFQSNWAEEDVIVARNGLHEAKNYIQYIRSFAFCLCTFVSVGYGDIYSVTVLEEAFTSVFAFLAAFALLFVLATLTLIAEENQANFHRYEEKRRIADEFMNHRSSLSDELKKRIRDYYQFLWTEQRGFLSEELLGSLLPPHLHSHLHLVQLLPATSSMNPVIRSLICRDTAFMVALCAHVEVFVTSANEVLFQAQEINERMFVVKKGLLEVKKGHIVLSQLSENMSYGFDFNTLLYDKPSPVTLVAKGHANLIKIHRDAFWNVVSMFPKMETLFEDTLKDKKALQRNMRLLTSSSHPDIDKKKIQAMYGRVDSTVEKKKTYHIFHPKERVAVAWSAFVAMLYVFMLLVVPARLCFADDVVHWSYYFDGFVCIASIADVYLVLNHIGFYDEKRARLCLKHDQIYAKWRPFLVFDIICVIPFDFILMIVFSVTGNDNLGKVVFAVSLLHLLRYRRRLGNVYSLINDTVSAMEETLLKLLKETLLLVLVGHYFACFWYMLANMEDHPRNWTKRIEMPPLLQSLPVDPEAYKVDSYQSYFSALYYVLVTMSTCGYGDMRPGTALETVYSFVLIIVGVVVWSKVTADMASLFANIDITAGNYETTVDKWKTWMSHYEISKGLARNHSNNEVKEIGASPKAAGHQPTLPGISEEPAEEGVELIAFDTALVDKKDEHGKDSGWVTDSKLRADVLRYYERLWITLKGVEEHAGLAFLSDSLRQDVAHNLYLHVLQKVSVFNGLPNFLMRALCAVMQPRIYITDSFLIGRGHTVDSVYFILTGKVNIFDVRCSNILMSLSEGAFFGEESLCGGFFFARNPIQACLDCEVITLAYADVMEVFQAYPSYNQAFRQAVYDEYSDSDLIQASNPNVRKTFADFAKREDIKHAEAGNVVERKKKKKQFERERSSFSQLQTSVNNQLKNIEKNLGKASNGHSASKTSRKLSVLFERESVAVEQVYPFMSKNWTTKEHSSLHLTWNLLGLFAVMFKLYSLPVFICLAQYRSYSSLGIALPWQLWGAIGLNVIFDLFFIADLYFRYFRFVPHVLTLFRTMDFVQLEIFPKDILKFYTDKAHSWFWIGIDIFHVIPSDMFYLIYGAISGNFRFEIFSMVRLNRLLLIAHFPHLFQSLDSLFDHIFVRFNLKFTFQTRRMIKIGLICALVVHWAALLWLFAGKRVAKDGEITWYTLYQDEQSPWAEVYPQMFKAMTREGVGFTFQYLVSLYWSIATLTTTGFGDVTATNQGEMIIVISTLFLGNILFAVLMGSLSINISNTYDSALLHHERMRGLISYVQRVGTSAELVKRVVDHVSFNRSERLRSQVLEVEPDVLGFRADLPEYLSTEVASYTYQNFFKEFVERKRQIDPQMPLDMFVCRMIAPKLTSRSYVNGEIIAKAGDVAMELFFLMKGSVVCSREHYDTRNSPRDSSSAFLRDSGALSLDQKSSLHSPDDVVLTAPDVFTPEAFFKKRGQSKRIHDRTIVSRGIVRVCVITRQDFESLASPLLGESCRIRPVFQYYTQDNNIVAFDAESVEDDNTDLDDEELEEYQRLHDLDQERGELIRKRIAKIR